MYTFGGELKRPIGGDESGRQEDELADRQGLLLALSVAGLLCDHAGRGFVLLYAGNGEERTTTRTRTIDFFFLVRRI